jgi:hypothetical protein
MLNNNPNMKESIFHPCSKALAKFYYNPMHTFLQVA